MGSGLRGPGGGGHPGWRGRLAWLGRAMTDPLTGRRRTEQLAGCLDRLLATSPAVHYGFRLEEGGRWVPAFVSARLREWGFEPATLLGNPDWWVERLHPEERKRVLAWVRQALRGEGPEEAHEYRLRGPDGHYRWIQDRFLVVRDEAGRAREVVGSWLDVSERHRLARELERRAFHDPLTGLPDRALFVDRIAQAIPDPRAEPWPVTVMLVKVGRLSEVNHTLGHKAGDRLLLEVAGRVRGAVRVADTVARVGSDEFGVLVAGADAARAVELARKLVQLAERPVQLGETAVPLGARIGIAACPEHAVSAEELLQRAEIALQQAQRDGAAWRVFDPQSNPYSRRRLRLLGDLRAALEDDQGIVLHVQPKVDLRAGGRVVGGEALARWLHPREGTIAPLEFVSLAEQSGLIGALTECVLHRALELLCEWYRDGLELTLAVNLSAQNLIDPAQGGRLTALLDRYPGPAERLTLEITETALMRQPEIARQVLASCHELGVRVSIDDFGTGYSSLAYLKELAVDELKIDTSFVADLLENEHSAVLVRNIIQLGHDLDLEVVAEGVETPAVAARLRELGCDLAQGFCIATPMPAAEFRAWYEALPSDRGGQPGEPVAVRR